MAEETVITSAIDFLTKIKEQDEVTLQFEKKDGTKRTMRCTLSFDKIPASQRPKSVSLPRILKMIQQDNLLHVFDLEKVAWRSVNFAKVDWMQAHGQMFSIRPDGFKIGQK